MLCSRLQPCQQRGTRQSVRVGLQHQVLKQPLPHHAEPAPRFAVEAPGRVVRKNQYRLRMKQTLAVGADLTKIESIVAVRESATSVEIEVVVDGTTETLRAPVLIGADGSNGPMRRLGSMRSVVDRVMEPG